MPSRLEKEKKKKKTKKHKALSILAKTLLALFILIVLLLLFIRSPWGQNLIIDKIASSVSKKTGTTVKVDHIYFTFLGNISIDGLYIEAENGDTLIYSKSLEADVPLWPIITGDGISVNSVAWNGLTANIVQKDSLSGFNYQFLIDAYTSAETAEETQDTTASHFNLGSLHFTNFDVNYIDAVSGINFGLTLQEFKLKMEAFDLQQMLFHIDEARLTNASVRYFQSKSVPESSDSAQSAMPSIIIDNLSLQNVTARYKSTLDGMTAKARIGEFILKMPKANLAEKNIRVDKFILNNSSFRVRTKPSEAPQKKESIADTETTDFQWPDWRVHINTLSLNENKITYLAKGQTPVKGTFNPGAIDLENLNIQLRDFYLREKQAGVELKNLSFSEASGIDFRHMAFHLKIDNERILLNNFVAHVNKNRVEGVFSVAYPSFKSFMETPANSSFEVEIPQVKLDVSGLFLFQPELRQNKYLLALSSKPIAGNLQLSGTLARLQIPQFQLNWGSHTAITAHGRVRNLGDTEEIQFDFPQFDFISARADLLHFIPQDSLGIEVPKKVKFNSSFKGTLKNSTAKATLIIPEGKIAFDGSFSNHEQLALNIALNIDQLDIGKLLQNKQLDKISLSLKTRAEGSGLNSLDAKLRANISKFGYNGYLFEGLEMTGTLKNGEGPLRFQYKDQNLNMAFNAAVNLDSVSSEADLHFNLRRADLQALGVSSRAIHSRFILDAFFKSTADGFDLNASFTDAINTYDGNIYALGHLKLSAFIRADTTSVDVTNKMFNLKLRSNSSPEHFVTALQNHVESYFSGKRPVQDTLKKPVQLQLKASLSQAPILNELLVVNLNRLDTASVSINFNEARRSLKASMQLPYIDYNGSIIDSLLIQVNTDEENLKARLHFNAVNAGPIAIQRTNLSAAVADEQLTMDFESYVNDTLLVNIQSELKAKNDTSYFHINPSKFILNGNNWNIAPNNSVIIANNFIEFNDFKISRNDQYFGVTSENSQTITSQIAVNFKNFGLANFLGFLNPKKTFAEGILDGKLIIKEPFKSTGLIAQLGIEQLNVMEIPLGNLTLNGKALDNQKYTFDLALKDGAIDLDANGTYQSDSTETVMDFEVALNELKLSAIEQLTDGKINDTQGNISGNFEINGPSSDLKYAGVIHFNETAFKIAMLNAPFGISGESIRIDNTGIYFDTFKIEDKNGDSFVLDGEIATKNITNPSFDLNFEANNFQALQSTKEDSDLFYGTAIFDADAQLTGDLALPVLNLELTIHPETNLTYIIPESELAMVERDGIVVFVDKENPDSTLIQREEEATSLSGIVVNSVINIGENSVFNVIIDEQTGDNLSISGVGKLNFSISETGRMQLAGRYELTGGHYSMNLYNLVSRRFEIVPGSTISWFGDPLDAGLDVSAVYKVETSASALMAAQISGISANMQSKYRQELPFLVYLNVDGRLMQPELSFGIDMPEEAQGALGGEVYARVQQLKSLQNERNKQVFSLLVLGRFYPQANSYGSQGGTLTLARDNLNRAISDQLNTFADRLLKDSGVALNFGLDSYTDYQGAAPEQRTTLEISAEKRFLDDRLIVEVGSEVDLQGSDPEAGAANPLIGNVSIQYLLTRDGRYRLKAFRRNAFENFIDGQIIINGIALIFAREFNEFKRIFAREIIQSEEEN